MEVQMKSLMEEESNGEEMVYKLVPWINWEEWDFVRDSLFSSSPDNIAVALKRISAWKMRGCLPVVIDVTACIIEAQQQDPHLRKDLTDPLVSENLLAMLYCMAIIRLVNGVVDQDRKGKKDERKLSINQAGDEIGLPRKLIDIRHEASHRDLPSLQLLRVASIEALDWIKSHYWDHQKSAIPFQRDQVDVVRKQIKLKLHELASHLKVKQDSHVDSLPMKRKRNKQPNVIFGRYNPFSIKGKKHQGSHSQGPKNQITRIIRYLYRLYTSSPSEVVAVLLEFLKASDFSDSNDKEPSDDLENSKTEAGISDLCKLVITRLSSKEPELVLIMFKAVLETLETHFIAKSENGGETLNQTEQLSSLALWLIRIYNKLQKHTKETIHDDQPQCSKVALTELLKKSLLASSSNNHLTRSALLLAQITGKNSIIEQLKKLSQIYSPNMESPYQSSQTILQAEESLNLLKRRFRKDNTTAPNEGGWSLAKSWNPCPIGMLPGSLGSIGILPSLDKVIKEKSFEPEVKESLVQKKPDTIEETEVEDDEVPLLDPLKGRLMVCGAYTKIRPEELLSIESSVKILV